MGLYKRGHTWWFKFKYAGRVYRESAGTASASLAGKIERKRRREVEESTHGIARPTPPALFTVAAKDWLSVNKETWAPKDPRERFSRRQPSEDTFRRIAGDGCS